MWNRLSEMFLVKHQYEDESNPNLYMDVENVVIYDTNCGFVKTQRVIRNVSDNWVKVKMSNGRVLTCTKDHPFDIVDKGRTMANDLEIGDIVTINHSQPTGKAVHSWEQDLAWAYGVIICDGNINSCRVSVSLALDSENDIIEKLKVVLKKYYNVDCTVKELHRESEGRGAYKEVEAYSKQLVYDCIRYFEGINKDTRHVPNILFSMNYKARLGFLAGMIDADGFVSYNSRLSSVHIGAINKELALQQLALMQSLGMPACNYDNHYNKNKHEKIRHKITCIPTEELIELLCDKKRNHFVGNTRLVNTRNTLEVAMVKSVEYLFMEDEKFSYDVTTESDHFEVSGIYSYNCRSFLAPWKDENGNSKFYGRFNIGVVTLNLVDIALSSNGDFEKFWQLFEERTELCHRALMCRHKKMTGVLSDIAPILWQDGALARLEKGERIDKLLHNGYASASLGYAGLYECVKYMTGCSHTDNSTGYNFGIEVMEFLNKKCNQWNAEENIGFSVYGTPIESTTYKFAKSNRDKFGVIEGITDRDYVTNSYHVPVFEQINAYDKLSIESVFQSLSSGGAVSYIETPDMSNNIEGVLQIMKFIYNNIMYAELNTKSDYCQICGFDGEIKCIDDGNELTWQCPNCFNTDKTKMNVARRTCGYIGTNFWNQGRTSEIMSRVLHVDDFEYTPKEVEDGESE